MYISVWINLNWVLKDQKCILQMHSTGWSKFCFNTIYSGIFEIHTNRFNFMFREMDFILFKLFVLAFEWMPTFKWKYFSPHVFIQSDIFCTWIWILNCCHRPSVVSIINVLVEYVVLFSFLFKLLVNTSTVQ